jgi:hypothetical protein
MLPDGFPKRGHGRVINADAFQTFVQVRDIIEIRAPDSCGFDNHIGFASKSHGIIDQIAPLVDKDLRCDFLVIFKRNDKRTPFAGFSLL